MRLVPLLIVLGMLFASRAHAFDKAHTLPLAEMEDLQILGDGFKLNNISFQEKPALFKEGLFNFQVSLSIRNRGEAPKSLTVMMVGMGTKAGEILWAIDLAPPFFTVAPGTTAPASGSAYVTEGTLAKTKKVWIRVVGNF